MVFLLLKGKMKLLFFIKMALELNDLSFWSNVNVICLFNITELNSQYVKVAIKIDIHKPIIL